MRFLSAVSPTKPGVDYVPSPIHFNWQPVVQIVERGSSVPWVRSSISQSEP